MTISRADTVVGEYFTATSSRLRLRTEIELHRFPSIPALSLQAERCSGLVAAMHHTIFAPAITRDSIDNSIAGPVRLFQELRVAREMAIGHQITRTLPATDVSRGNRPGRTSQVPFASEKFKIDRCSEKRVLIYPVFDFSEFLNGHGAGEEKIFRPQI